MESVRSAQGSGPAGNDSCTLGLAVAAAHKISPQMPISLITSFNYWSRGGLVLFCCSNTIQLIILFPNPLIGGLGLLLN